MFSSINYRYDMPGRFVTPGETEYRYGRPASGAGMTGGLTGRKGRTRGAQWLAGVRRWAFLWLPWILLCGCSADHLAMGGRFLAQGDYEAAARNFEHSIPRNAQDPALQAIAYYFLVFCNLEKGNTPQAVQDFSDAIALEPGFIEAYCIRGKVYCQERQYISARRDYEHALGIIDDDIRLAHEKRIRDDNMLLSRHFRYFMSLRPLPGTRQQIFPDPLKIEYHQKINFDTLEKARCLWRDQIKLSLSRISDLEK